MRGGAAVFNRVVSVSLEEKMTFEEDLKGLRKFASWISRGRISNRDLK